jgi:uncharacterized protein
MVGQDEGRCTVFTGTRKIASGTLAEVAAEAKRAIDSDEKAWVYIFDDTTGERIDVEFRGSLDEVLANLPSRNGGVAVSEASPAQRGPGRPKLGVVAREVTLLPRHWDWLNRQPGGASVALRRLVDEARSAHGGRDIVRRSREAAYRFMSAMTGDNIGFEEATRTLFAGNERGFDEHTAGWPRDVRDYARSLAAPSFAGSVAED